MPRTTANRLLVSALSLATPACAGEPCSAMVVHAIRLAIVDTDGNTVASAEISVAHEDDGGAPSTKSCGAEGPPCSEVSIGEAEGVYTITVEAAGYAPRDVVVDVGGDGCHATTEDVEVELVPA